MADTASAQSADGMPLATRLFARFAAGGRVGNQERALAAVAVVDTMAVMLAGGSAGPVRRLEEALETVPHGVASFWTGKTRAPQDAATLFGMASHMLDYDDVSMLTVCHPSAPILSALLAVRPWTNLSAPALLDAFVVGTEVLIRLGQAMGFRHYSLGFHATSTLGTVGAAAACGRLMGLDVARLAHALAIAASMASGLRKNFGSAVKPLHVGIAAANGLRAAQWAAAGIEGADEILERDGFLKAFSGGETDAWPDGLDLGRPFAVVEPGFERKRYPYCYLLHKIIEATLDMAAQDDIRLDQLAGAHIEVPPGGGRPLIHPRPQDGLEARFSAPYAVLASIEDRHMGLAGLKDAAVTRARIQSRLPLVRLIERDGPVLSGSEIEAAPVVVRLELQDGRSVERTISVTPGSARDPVTAEQLRAKWLDCCREARPDGDAVLAEALFAEGMRLAEAATMDGWLSRLAELAGGRHG